jgi:hypothetical protein
MRLFDMSPDFTAANLPHRSPAVVVCSSKFVDRVQSSFEAVANLTHILWSEHGIMMILAAWNRCTHPIRVRFAMRVAALCDHVRNIVSISSKEQMFRANARRIITVMQDKQTRGDHSIRKLIGDTMRIVLFVPDTKSTIPIRVGARRPKPAWAASVYLRPKAIFKRWLGLGRANPPQQIRDTRSDALWSMFGNAIRSVVIARSKEEMIGADAWRGIAGMANLQIARSHAVCQLKGEAVNHIALAFDLNCAISPFVRVACPIPATISHFDARPKPIGVFWGKMMGHRLSLLHRLEGCHAPAVSAARGFAYSLLYQKARSLSSGLAQQEAIYNGFTGIYSAASDSR